MTSKYDSVVFNIAISIWLNVIGSLLNLSIDSSGEDTNSYKLYKEISARLAVSVVPPGPGFDEIYFFFFRSNIVYLTIDESAPIRSAIKLLVILLLSYLLNIFYSTNTAVTLTVTIRGIQMREN